MRRFGVTCAIAGCLAALLSCSAGLMSGSTGAGRDVVLAGSNDVMIDRRGLARFSITYRLPPKKTFHDLRRTFEHQGWRRIGTNNVDRFTLTFARSSIFGFVREIVIVSVDQQTRRTVTVSLARCVRFQGWFRCP